MESKMEKHADYTNYPKLFENTYWGQYRSEPPEDNIVENRNRFVEQFSIKSKVNKIPKRIKNNYWHENKGYKKNMDHVEVYKTRDDKYLIVNSPYNSIHTCTNLNDWIPTNGLYSNNAGISYYKII